MGDPGGISTGEVGGIIAGAITILGTVGAGVRWLLGWRDRQEESRATKLQKWHDELSARETRLDEERATEIASLRDDIARLRREHGMLLSAYQLIAGAMRVIDAGNPALRMADELLRAAFPLRGTPADMSALADRIDQTTAQP